MKRMVVVLVAAMALVSAVQTGIYAEGAGTAQWIWYPEKDMDPIAEAPAEPRYFVKIFSLEAAPKSAKIEVAVDNVYQLFVNGKSIGEGDNWQAATVYDITKNLKTGKNTIAILATNQDGPAGFIVAGGLVTADGKKVSLVSNSTWKASDKATKGWQDGVEDKSWVKALEMGEYGSPPWGTNVQSEMIGQ